MSKLQKAIVICFLPEGSAGTSGSPYIFLHNPPAVSVVSLSTSTRFSGQWAERGGEYKQVTSLETTTKFPIKSCKINNWILKRK